LEEIIEIAKEAGIELHFFTAPVYKPNYSLDNLETQLPNHLNFIDAIQDRKFFNDPTHLNAAGAELFTKLFIETYF
jgi:hypothetical protein